MKANRPASLRPLITAAALAALVASCASPPPPAPPPPPRPQPTYTPAPPPQVDRTLDWRDAPITPGSWNWSRSGGASTAHFAEGPAGPTLEIRCDRAAGSVLLIRSGAADRPVPLTITTTSTARPLVAQPLPGRRAIAVALPARDSLLDAIVFSRGRLVVEAQGMTPVFAPTWPEIARVIEDCR